MKTLTSDEHDDQNGRQPVDQSIKTLGRQR